MSAWGACKQCGAPYLLGALGDPIVILGYRGASRYAPSLSLRQQRRRSWGSLGRERGDRSGHLLTAVPYRSDAVDVGDMSRRIAVNDQQIGKLPWLDNTAIVESEQRGGVLSRGANSL
jgi:hypothetical protein